MWLNGMSLHVRRRIGGKANAGSVLAADSYVSRSLGAEDVGRDVYV